MIGVEALKEFEIALNMLYPAQDNIMQIYLAYLDPIPNHLIKQSIQRHNHAILVNITGQSTSSEFTINTFNDVFEIDAVLGVFAKSNRYAYNKLKDVLIKFGFGLSGNGNLYKRAMRPFVLGGTSRVLVHDCSYYGGYFKPLVEQFEENWFVSHEISIVLSITE